MKKLTLETQMKSFLNLPQNHSFFGNPSQRLLGFGSPLKTIVSCGLLTLVAVNNSAVPTLAQQLNQQSQSSSTSPEPNPQQNIQPLETPNCENNITFSEYSLGTAINKQYGDKGIVFGGSNPFIVNDGANPTSPVLSGTPLFAGAIEGSFVIPEDNSVPAISGNFQMDAGYFDSEGSTTLKLYDSEGKLIAQKTNTGLGIFRFNAEGLPVAKWRIEATGSEPAGFAIDNVCFSLQTAVQSPRLYPEGLGNDETLDSAPDSGFDQAEIYQPGDPAVAGMEEEQQTVDEEIIEPDASQDPTSVESDALTVDPSTTAQKSCQGLGTPINETDFSKMAKKVLPGASPYKIRIAFENFSLRSENLRKYKGPGFPSAERSAKTRGKFSRVEPEAATTTVVLTKILPLVPRVPIPYPESAFWDAKLKRPGKKISLSEGKYQTQGYLDYLSHNSTAALAPVPKSIHPVGHLIYITPSDTGITSGVLNYTSGIPGISFTPVAVYQAVACLSGNSELRIGRGILLNGERFTGYPRFLLRPLPAGRATTVKLTDFQPQ